MRFATLLNHFVLALAVSSAGGVARADMHVTESRQTGYSVGTVLPDEAELDVPNGATLRLLILPAGTQILIHGPYRGRAADYVNRTRSWFDQLLGPDDRSSEEPVGGTRGAPAPPER